MKIVNIEETKFKTSPEPYSTRYEGIVIELDDGSSYKLGIDDNQHCCEESGYLTSNDNYDEFIGAEFLDCYITTQDLCTIDNLPDVYEGDMMFFTIKTSKGDLQFVAYNIQNGYYGHEVLVLKDDVVLKEGVV